MKRWWAVESIHILNSTSRVAMLRGIGSPTKITIHAKWKYVAGIVLRPF